MQPLTHQERESIKKEVRGCESLLNLDDDLIGKISSLLTEIKTGTGLERVFYHNTLELINFIRNNHGEKVCSFSRAALHHILTTYKNTENRPWLLVLQEMSFVASFAVSEVKASKDISIESEHMILDADERKLAEEMLLGFMETPEASDQKLCEHAMSVIINNSTHRTSGIISRFQDNLRFLCNVLKNDKWNHERKCWARGALSYVYLKDDLIPDSLGIVGLLDDIYVAQTAHDLIQPDQYPWIELLSELNSAWPFLKELILEHGGKEYTFSDFSLVNTALICPELHDQQCAFKTNLVVPAPGMAPLYISLCAALGLIYTSVRSKRNEIGFEINQKILVDNKAVAIYDGIDHFGEESFIRLKQFNVKNGKKLSTTSMIPVSESSRLCPAPQEKKTRGNIATRLYTTDIPLSAIERLLHLQYPLQFSSIKGRVWLISVSSNINKLMKETSIFGQKLIDVFPVGHVKRDGGKENWGSKHGLTAPIMTVISDMDLAVEIIEDEDVNEKDCIIIDMTGINSSRISSYNIFRGINARVLCIIDEKNASLVTDLNDNDISFWEWQPDQAKKLLSKTIRENRSTAHPFNKSDILSERSYSVSTCERILTYNTAQDTYKHIDDINHYVHDLKGDVSHDFNKAYDRLISAFIRLTRNPLRVTESAQIFTDVRSDLDTLLLLISESLFLSEHEHALIKASAVQMENLLDEIKVSNPKAEELTTFIDNQTDSKILLPNRKHIPTNETHVINNDKYIAINELDNMDIQTLVIPFWPGKNLAWKLISKPCAKSIQYVLYEFEYKWKKSFDNNRNYQRSTRSKLSNISTVFPTVNNWPQYDNKNTPHSEIHSINDNDLIEARNERRAEIFIKKACTASEAADTQASFVMFHGNVYAFLTDIYEAHSVTHLLHDNYDDIDNATVKNKTIKELITGDVLVFLRGTSKNAIRVLADTNLPDGTREVANLWQKALRKRYYSGATDYSYKKLRDELLTAGCKRHIATIKHWIENDDIIGPRDASNGTLEAIAKATGDKELISRVKECGKAISLVLGEHLKAASTIAKRVLSEVHKEIIDDFEIDEPYEIGDQIVLVRIDYIRNTPVLAPKSSCNHLLEYD